MKYILVIGLVLCGWGVCLLNGRMVVRTIGAAAATNFVNDARCIGAWAMNVDNGTETDVSTNGNDLLIISSPGGLFRTNDVAGTLTGYSREFNESADSEWLRDDPPGIRIQNLSTALTVSAWIKLTSDPASVGAMTIIAVGSATTNEAFNIQVNGSGLLSFSESTTGSDLISRAGTYDVPISNWVHVAATWVPGAANEVEFFTNGVPHETISTPTSTTIHSGPNAEISIGNDPRGGLYFDGFIDEAFLADAILSDSEILSIYQNSMQATGGE